MRGMRSRAKKVGQDVLINAASLASWSTISLGDMPVWLGIHWNQMWIERTYRARRRDKIFIHRNDAWNWDECLGRRAGTSRVSEDVHSDAKGNLFWKKVAEVLKKNQHFSRKDSVLGGQVTETTPDIFQQTPVYLQI